MRDQQQRGFIILVCVYKRFNNLEGDRPKQLIIVKYCSPYSWCYDTHNMARNACSLNNVLSWFSQWPFKPAFRQHQAANFICLCLCICWCIWWFAPVSPAVQRHIMTTSCQAATCSTPHPPNPCVTLCDCGRAVNILPLPFNQFPTSNPSSLIPEVPNNPSHPTHWSYLLPRQTPAFAIRWPAQFQKAKRSHIMAYKDEKSIS